MRKVARAFRYGIIASSAAIALLIGGTQALALAQPAGLATYQLAVISR